MSNASMPANEAARLHSLHDLQVLNTAPEAQFDTLVKVASLVCGVPISLISVIDDDRPAGFAAIHNKALKVLCQSIRAFGFANTEALLILGASCCVWPLLSGKAMQRSIRPG